MIKEEIIKALEDAGTGDLAECIYVSYAGYHEFACGFPMVGTLRNSMFYLNGIKVFRSTALEGNQVIILYKKTEHGTDIRKGR